MRSPNHRFSGHRPATLSCVMTCVMTLLAAGCASTSRSSCFEDHDPLMGTDLQWCGDDAIGSHGDSLRPDTDLMSLTPARAELGGSTHYYVRMRYQGWRVSEFSAPVTEEKQAQTQVKTTTIRFVVFR